MSVILKKHRQADCIYSHFHRWTLHVFVSLLLRSLTHVAHTWHTDGGLNTHELRTHTQAPTALCCIMKLALILRSSASLQPRPTLVNCWWLDTSETHHVLPAGSTCLDQALTTTVSFTLCHLRKRETRPKFCPVINNQLNLGHWVSKGQMIFFTQMI